MSVEKVTYLGANAFYACMDLESISLPNVTEIFDNTFAWCTALKSAYIPKVTVVGKMAFYMCSLLRSVEMPEVTAIDTMGFYYCTSLESANIPKATIIGKDAFHGCESLMSVIMPGAIEIGEAAFGLCAVLADVNISKTVTSIGDRAFSGCRKLLNITVDSENQYYSEIDGVVFSKDKTKLVAFPSGREGKYTIPEGVTTIGKLAFSACYSLTDIDTSDVTSIDEEAFYYCTDLENVNMPNVADIGVNAFEGCGITAVNMPKVTTIGDKAFYNCRYLKSISMPSVQELGQNVFERCSGLTSVSMDSIISVGDSSFYACSNLKSVSIPNATTIEFGAFDSCTSLTDIYMPKVTTLDRWAFNNCQSLANVDMPSVTSIGGLAFGYCISLTNINMPKVTTVGIRAFAASSIKNIDLSNVTSIGKNAFADCENVTICAPLNSYAHQYALDNNIKFSALKYKNISHKIADGKIIFTVITAAGEYDRVKVASLDNPKGYIAYTSKYTVDADGNYVWTIKADAPVESTVYTFDIRSAANKNYYRQYYNYEVEIVPTVKSVSHEVTGGKIIFTVVTNAGDYNRIKLALANDLKGYVAYTGTYTVNSDGDYVWTIKSNAPTQTTKYAFDLRSSENNKYLREYSYYEAEIISTVKSVKSELVGNKVVFTVVTNSGEYNRVKLMYADNLKSYIAYTSSYTVNSDGDYVWTIKTTAPESSTNYVFDIRSAETGKYLKDYYSYRYVVSSGVDPADSNNWNKVVNNVFTSDNGGFQMKADGWKTYSKYGISMVPEEYNDVGNSNAICVQLYSPDSADDFANKTKADFEGIIYANIDLMESTTVCGYPAYKVVVNDTYYLWVINTNNYKYFINFMQAPADMGGYSFAEEAEAMMATVDIFK